MTKGVSCKKNYVFVTPFITMLGGSQLYILRKMKWLESIGWRVVVLSTVDGKVMIPEFDQFRSHIYPVLSVPAYCVPKWRRDSLCKKILAKIGNAKEWFFQSHDEPCATWAELLAAKVKGIHLCHLLSETFLPQDEMMLDFLRFKRSQSLLRGITDKSIPLLLPNEPESENLGLSAVGCSWGNVSDCACEMLDHLDKADYTILVFGRLIKPTVSASLEAVAQFAAKFSCLKINLLVLGDTVQNSIKRKLQNQMSRIANIKATWLGNLFPIPRKVFAISDVCLASAGCVHVAARERCLCISIDAQDLHAIGIMGITTRHTLYREQEPQREILDCLVDVLKDRKYRREEISYRGKDLDYSEHLRLLSFSESQYYGFKKELAISLGHKMLSVVLAAVHVGCFFRIRNFGGYFYQRLKYVRFAG